MKRKAFAKINLTLDVVSRREDGYHELEMVMVPIDLFDTIRIEKSKKMKMRTNRGYLPVDNRNTVIHAINLLKDKYHFEDNFDITLVKNTPTRAGMGGGSSNGALAIRMVNDKLNLNMSEEEMLEVAKEVGSDVPFTLFGRPAIVKGVGDQLEPLKNNLEIYLFIIKPKKGISTPQLFKRLDIDNLKHYDVRVVKEALENNDYELFLKSIGNTLEDAAFEFVPEIRKAKDDLIKFGFDAALMSGAGSSVFGITQNEQLVNDAVIKFYKKYDFVKKARIINDVREEEIIE